MDVLDNFGMSGRTFKLVYYGNLVFWGMLITFLILFIILELVKDNAHSQVPNSQGTSDSIRMIIPDMKDILLWGYRGRGVKVNVSGLFPGHLEEYEDGYLKYNMNKYLSDRISMRRPLPDVRDSECREVTYDLRDLPSTSVVVVFRNEPRTTLLRMLYSVIDRSPLEIIADIILVDDGAEMEDLQYPKLEHYLSGLKQVSIVRLMNSVGTTQARMHGARKATGSVVIFLQPRCECTEGWMLPLLHAIVSHSSTIAVPVVDTIDYATFQYSPVTLSELTVGSFTWELATRKRALTNPVENATLNTFNPVIVDGIFALTRDNLFKLGGFDEGLILEDSANIEFSFRSWLCGSQIVLVPCSHVGHITPRSQLQQPGVFSKDRIQDSLSVADRWMGTYRYFVYERIAFNSPIETRPSQTVQTLPQANASCHNFDWFLQELEPAMSFTEEIQRRGLVVLAGAGYRTLGLRILDDNIVLQNWVSGPFTIWYHLKSGALVSENKTCLSFRPERVTTEQLLETKYDSLDVDESVLGPPMFVYQQQFESQIKEAPVERQTQEQLTSNSLLRVLHQGELKRNPQLIQTKQNTERHKSSYMDKLSIPKYNGLRQNNVNSKKNQKRVEITLQETHIRGRSLLNSVAQDFDVIGPLSMAPASQSSLRNRSESDSLTFQQESVDPLVNGLVVKPCVSENEDDHWIYTETHTLQHQASGLCLEAQKHKAGTHLLRMVKCMDGGQTQQWSFVTSLMSV